MRKAFTLALLALGAVLTACSRPPDFTISLNPTSLTVQQGSRDTTRLTITPQNGFTGTVNLELVGAPSGVTLSPSSVNVTGSGPVTETLTVNVDSTVNAGDYDLLIKATSRNLNKTAPLSLKVTGPTGTETLSGMVVSENAGGPVAGSQVRLMRGGTLVATTTTDAQGAFTFANIPAGPSSSATPPPTSPPARPTTTGWWPEEPTGPKACPAPPRPCPPSSPPS